MATFYNQASLNVGGRVTNSNVTEGEVSTQVAITKAALTTDYGPDDNIVYMITIVNNGASLADNITLTDNLGAFTIAENEIVPLTYVDDTVKYYINGLIQPTPTVTEGVPLTISGITVPAGAVATIIYEARANEFAPRGENAYIRNTVTGSGENVCEDLTATVDVPARVESNLTIAKAICPDSLTCGDTVTYTIIIQNTGNAAVVATDNLTVTDIFNPALNNINVQLNGSQLTEGTDYEYNEDTGEFTTTNGTVTVPAATFTRDGTTGVITTTPGVAVLTITGNI